MAPVEASVTKVTMRIASPHVGHRIGNTAQMRASGSAPGIADRDSRAVGREIPAQVSANSRLPSFSIRVTSLSPGLSHTCLSFG